MLKFDKLCQNHSQIVTSIFLEKKMDTKRTFFLLLEIASSLDVSVALDTLDTFVGINHREGTIFLRFSLDPMHDWIYAAV